MKTTVKTVQKETLGKLSLEVRPPTPPPTNPSVLKNRKQCAFFLVPLQEQAIGQRGTEISKLNDMGNGMGKQNT